MTWLFGKGLNLKRAIRCPMTTRRPNPYVSRTRAPPLGGGALGPRRSTLSQHDAHQRPGLASPLAQALRRRGPCTLTRRGATGGTSHVQCRTLLGQATQSRLREKVIDLLIQTSSICDANACYPPITITSQPGDPTSSRLDCESTKEPSLERSRFSLKSLHNESF